MTNGTKVTKRNGKNEPLDLNKLHVMVEEACKDLAGVSASQVEIQSGIQFYDGITTDEIQEILIRSASDLVSLDNPNYQFVAARLLLFAVRKQLYGRMHETPTVKEQVEQCVAKKFMMQKYLTCILMKNSINLSPLLIMIETICLPMQVCVKYVISILCRTGLMVRYMRLHSSCIC